MSTSKLIGQVKAAQRQANVDQVSHQAHINDITESRTNSCTAMFPEELTKLLKRYRQLAKHCPLIAKIFSLWHQLYEHNIVRNNSAIACYEYCDKFTGKKYLNYVANDVKIAIVESLKQWALRENVTL